MKRRSALLAIGGVIAGCCAAAAPAFAGTTTATVSTQGVTYPLGRYELDQHVDAGLTDPAGVIHLVPHMLAAVIWSIDRLSVSVLIGAFARAFDLDLISDPHHGLLASVAATAQQFHAGITMPLMGCAILVLGICSMWTMLAQRRYSDGLAQIATSIAFCLIATAIILSPERTIGTAASYANDASQAVLSAAAPGGTGTAEHTLHELLIDQPFVLLDFGSPDQCVNHQGESVEPASYTASGDGIAGPGDVCENASHYAAGFLNYDVGSDKRDAAYNALKNGNPAQQQLVAIQQAGGGYERVALALAVLLASLGAIILIGSLTFGMIASQLLAILLVAMTPIVLLSSFLPGHGHAVFRRWLGYLAVAIYRKATYTLYLALTIALATQLQQHTASLGPGTSWATQAALWWGTLIWGRSLTRRLTTGGQVASHAQSARQVVVAAAGPVGAAAARLTQGGRR